MGPHFYIKPLLIFTIIRPKPDGPKKHPWHYWLSEGLSDFNIFWYEYFWHNWPPNHQTTVQVPTSPNVCFCTTRGKQNTGNRRWGEQKTSKNVPDIIDCNWDKDDQILIGFGRSIADTSGTKRPFKFPPHPTPVLALPAKYRTCENVRWNEQKMSINLSLRIGGPQQPWPRSSVCSLTMFAVSCSSESIGCRLWMLVNSRSDWLKSGAEHYRHCYQWMEKASAWPCSHKGHKVHIYCKQLDNWTIG